MRTSRVFTSYWHRLRWDVQGHGHGHGVVVVNGLGGLILILICDICTYLGSANSI